LWFDKCLYTNNYYLYLDTFNQHFEKYFTEIMNNENPDNLRLTTSEGKEYQIPIQGSLGLLAYGYTTLRAWRSVKDAAKKETATGNQQESNTENKD